MLVVVGWTVALSYNNPAISYNISPDTAQRLR